MAEPDQLTKRINAIKFVWERGEANWQTTLRRLRLYMNEKQALELLRTWAAALGRPLES